MININFNFVPFNIECHSQMGAYLCIATVINTHFLFAISFSVLFSSHSPWRALYENIENNAIKN